MILAWLCFFDGLVALAVMAAGLVGAHFGQAAPSVGFQVFIIGLLNAAIGLMLGLVAVPMAMFSPARKNARVPAFIGFALSLVMVATVAVIVAPRLKYPPISDVSTDIANPPNFVHANQLPGNAGHDMSYSPVSAQLQQHSSIYAGLAPLKFPGSPDQVFKRVQIVAGEIPNWQILYTDPATHTLEGMATSKVFRFKDDFVIQVRPADGAGSLVEMRSRSRAQQADLGSNYDRIVSFFNDLQNPPSPAPPGTPQAQP
ncbi:MAG TPA: DUF1499 domain-containing protein [Candidatus Binataceae bacterium]|nr:DUF1499 domain-containing protein [Candidatus Binataceae bacterium]